MNQQPLYSLTKMTGREASSARTVVVGPAEFQWRSLVIMVIAFFAGLLPTAMLWMIMGVFAIGFLVLFVMASVWLFNGRTRSGLEIRNYVALLNKRRAILNEFMLGPAIVTVPHSDWRIVARGSMPNPARQVLPEDRAQHAQAATAAGLVQSIFD